MVAGGKGTWALDRVHPEDCKGSPQIQRGGMAGSDCHPLRVSTGERSQDKGVTWKVAGTPTCEVMLFFRGWTFRTRTCRQGDQVGAGLEPRGPGREAAGLTSQEAGRGAPGVSGRAGARSELRCRAWAGGGGGVLGRSQGESRQREGRTEPSEHSAEGSGGHRGGAAGSLSGSPPPRLIMKGSVVTFLKHYLRSPG